MSDEMLLPTTEQWSVTWGCGGAHGPGTIKILVSDQFHWRDEQHQIRVSLAFDEVVHSGVAWLSASRRGAAVLPLSKTTAVTQNPSDWWKLVDSLDQKDTSIFEELSELHDTDDSVIGKSIPILEKHQWFETNGEIPKDILNHNVFLEIVDDNENVIAQERPQAPRAERIDWQRRINKPGDPCHGLMPEECVYQILEDIKQQLCVTLSFLSIECLLLSSWMKADPPGIHVACNLDGAGTMATTDALTGEITINGDEFLKGEWLMETIIHEISHVIDHHTGKIEKFKKYKRAIKEGTEARDELTRLDRRPFEPNPEEWRRRRRCVLLILQESSRITDECFNDHIKELLETECRALFYVLAHSATLGHPGEATRCIIDSIKYMLVQLLGIVDRKSQETKDYVKPVLKDCFERIRDWINQPENREIKEAFENDKANPDSEHSWWDVLEAYIRFFGQN